MYDVVPPRVFTDLGDGAVKVLDLRVACVTLPLRHALPANAQHLTELSVLERIRRHCTAREESGQSRQAKGMMATSKLVRDTGGWMTVSPP